MTVSDRRHPDLYAAAGAFITEFGLHPDPATHLAHGYVNLCLAAWPTATGPELELATRWALWTWLVDDIFDTELRDATPNTVKSFVRALIHATNKDAHPSSEHPAARALLALAQEARTTMPAHWWRRYRTELIAWVDAAALKLTDYVQPARTPSLREYVTLRPADGGMLLAAMWTEIAERCITPDWRDPLVQSLLAAFSACGYLRNDLAAADGDHFTAMDALVLDQATSPAEARKEVGQLLHAEERRFWLLYTAVRNGFAHTETSRFALGLDRFRWALTEWTAGSSRYALPTQYTGAPWLATAMARPTEEANP